MVSIPEFEKPEQTHFSMPGLLDQVVRVPTPLAVE